MVNLFAVESEDDQLRRNAMILAASELCCSLCDALLAVNVTAVQDLLQCFVEMALC